MCRYKSMANEISLVIAHVKNHTTGIKLFSQKDEEMATATVIQIENNIIEFETNKNFGNKNHLIEAHIYPSTHDHLLLECEGRILSMININNEHYIYKIQLSQLDKARWQEIQEIFSEHAQKVEDLFKKLRGW